MKYKITAILALTILLCQTSSAQSILEIECYYNTKGGVNGLAIGDVNGDGNNEIIAGSYDGFIYLLDEACNKLWGYYARCPVYSAATIDLNNDNKTEAVGGNCQHIIVLDGKGDRIMRYQTGSIVRKIVQGDVNADGRKEMITASETATGSESNLNVIRADGENVWGKTFKGTFFHGLAAGDINGDGIDEVLSGTNSVIEYNNAGEILWTTKIDGNVESLSYADINNDGKKEVLVGTRLKFYLLDREGNILWEFDTHSPVEDAIVYDIKGGKQILIASNILYSLDEKGSVLWTYSTGNQVNKIKAYDIDSDGTQEIIIGSDIIYALSPEGVPIWNYRTYREVTGLEIDASKEDIRLIASAMDRNVYVFKGVKRTVGTTTTSTMNDVPRLPGTPTTTEPAIVQAATTTTESTTTTTQIKPQMEHEDSANVYLVGIVVVIVLAAIYFISEKIRGIR